MLLFTDQGGKEFVNFGDSRTAGFKLDNPEVERWTKLVSVARNATENNFASTGSTLEIQPVNGNVLNFNLLPVYDAIKHGYMELTIGTNDVRGSEYAPERGKQRLTDWMNLAISRGWPTSKVILASIYYFPNMGGGGSVERHLAYNAMFKQVAQQFNTPFVDFYTPTASNPNRDALFLDGLHENYAGQQYIRDLFLAADLTPINNIGAVVTPPQNPAVEIRFPYRLA